ncbi:MAG: hypothetical protein DI565_05065 [Ancylobacter novellus]|uniref:Uncharacterized protein n=1 Tax=Ancylobacter novellus TaxID=921 RepID=A0A2W5KLW9_ANCNO|nr:MAG: hypothetical protein DI565_05065 [Ancylobacter novellus]HML44356.1 hypothetical protein [Hyphomicrobium zavarzinii]
MAVKEKGSRRSPARAPRTGSRRHLDEATVARIREVILTWAALPLRWEDISAALKQLGVGSWTRQALAAKPEIVDAVKTRKVALAGGAKRRSRDPEVVILRRQVEDLQERMKELAERNAWYEERHLIMLRNAAVKGVSEAELMKALPPIDRSRF